MPTPKAYRMVGFVLSPEQLADLLLALRDEFRDTPETWENPSLGGYLEAIASFLRTAYDRPSGWPSYYRMLTRLLSSGTPLGVQHIRFESFDEVADYVDQLRAAYSGIPLDIYLERIADYARKNEEVSVDDLDQYWRDAARMFCRARDYDVSAGRNQIDPNMSDIHRCVGKPAWGEELRDYLLALQLDLKVRPKEWRNDTIEQYLLALSQWVRYNAKDPTAPREVWYEIASMLYCGKVRE